MANPRKQVQQNKPSGEEWLSINEAGKQLGVMRQTVLARIVDGDLSSQRVAGRTFVSRESVERLLKQNAA